jgi:nucleoside-diphosphate-sugar epimerase
MATKNILITGVNGFIGKHLNNSLQSKFNIIGIDKVRSRDNSNATILDLEKDSTSFVNSIKNTKLDCIVHLASYYDFSNKQNSHYEDTLNGFKSLISKLSYDVPIVSASSASTLYIGSELPYINNKKDTDNFVESLDVPSSTLLLGGVYSDKCELYMLYQIIERIRNKNPDMIFYPGNPDNGVGYINIKQVVKYIEESISNVINTYVKDKKLVCQDKVSYRELYDTSCLAFYDKKYPLVQVPKSVGKAGLATTNVIQRSNFFQPWMIDYCDADYPLYGSEFNDCNLVQDLESMLLYAKNYPEKWIEINKKRDMSRLNNV